MKDSMPRSSFKQVCFAVATIRLRRGRDPLWVDPNAKKGPNTGSPNLPSANVQILANGCSLLFLDPTA